MMMIFVMVVMVILMFESVGFIYYYMNQVIQNQMYIKIDKLRLILVIYFMAMGVYGFGGYSEKQVIQMVVLFIKV